MHVEQGPNARAYLQANREEPNFDELLAIGPPQTTLRESITINGGVGTYKTVEFLW